MQSLLVRVKNLCVILEERLLLKLLAFAGYNNGGQEQENVEENDFETQQILADVASVHSKRYYFEILELVLGQVSRKIEINGPIKLSRITALPPDTKRSISFRYLEVKLQKT